MTALLLHITERYCGMNYEDASKEAARLIRVAHETGNWWPIIEPLIQLRDLMQRQLPIAPGKAKRALSHPATEPAKAEEP